MSLNHSVPRISVVVLNYNGFEYLTETIPPLLKMRYPNMEIVVVDNHSVDESIPYLQSLRAPNLRIVQNSHNTGYCMGKNIGVETAAGEFILLLDEDTLIESSETLNVCLDFYQRLPSIGILGILLKETDDRDETKLYGGFIGRFSVFSNRPLPLRKLQEKEYHEASAPDGGAMFFKKKNFLELGGFDTSQPYYLDAGDLGPRAALFGYRTFIMTKHVGIHLGTIRKTNKAGWLWKYGYHFSGLARMMVKNYSAKNLWVALPYFFAFCLAKTAFNILRYKDIRVLIRFLFSIRLFLRRLPNTLQERSRLQRQRIVARDTFLFVEPPRS